MQLNAHIVFYAARVVVNKGLDYGMVRITGVVYVSCLAGLARINLFCCYT